MTWFRNQGGANGFQRPKGHSSTVHSDNRLKVYGKTGLPCR